MGMKRVAVCDECGGEKDVGKDDKYPLGWCYVCFSYSGNSNKTANVCSGECAERFLQRVTPGTHSIVPLAVEAGV